MKNESEKKNKDFFMMPLYFYDYGLQCFTHIEYDILGYILRNTIGWNDNRKECEISIKKIALMRHYSEKSIIKAINNLIAKTNVFTKIVYRDKGSCIKKTKYIITENSVKILSEYVKQNIPNDFEEKKEKLKNRTLIAMERIEKKKNTLIEKQQEILQNMAIENDIKNDSQNKVDMVNDDYRKSDYLLSAWHEIINDYYKDDYYTDDTFIEWKENTYYGYFGYVPEETYRDKIDVRLSDLLRFTGNLKTIDVFNTLIKNKKMIGGQSQNFYMSLKIDFKFNGNNFDRINVIYE